MQQQLFLFDKRDEQKDAAQQTAENNGMHKNQSEDEQLNNDENKNGEDGNGENIAAPIDADPFASVRQKEDEKIEQMLLMPNTRRGRKSFKDMDEEFILVAVP